MATKYSASSRRLMPSTPYHVRPDRCGIRRAYGPPYPARPATSYVPGVAASAMRRSSARRSGVRSVIVIPLLHQTLLRDGGSPANLGQHVIEGVAIDVLLRLRQVVPRNQVHVALRARSTSTGGLHPSTIGALAGVVEALGPLRPAPGLMHDPAHVIGRNVQRPLQP